MNNLLKYNDISYNGIVSQIIQTMKNDSRFVNIRESDVGVMINEIFGGVAEFLMHYMERRTEESWLDTSKLRGSGIVNARSLGYSVQRPIPSSANISITLSTDILNMIQNSNTILQIPQYTQFSYSNFNYILKNTVSLLITDDILNSGEPYTFTTDEFGKDITLIEGLKKTQTINGSTNPLCGQKFQSYRISDPTFSNCYGENDFDNPMTRVWVCTDPNEQNSTTEFQIDSRSLINIKTIQALAQNQTINMCVIRSAIDEGVELLFGDANFASLGAKVNNDIVAGGAQTSYDNIYVQYLSTIGSKGNQTGLIGELVNFNGANSSILLNNNTTVDSSLLTFNFITNPSGGADMESLDSIKINAPAIYYSLDRVVTAQDYQNYLKTLTTPIVIKNALAWGEQEEINNQNLPFDPKMFNIALFTCLGSLYQTDNSPYSPKDDLSQVVLDADYDINSVPMQSYLNIYVAQDQIGQLKTYQTSSGNWNIFGTPLASTFYNDVLSSNPTSTIMTVKICYTSDNNPDLSASYIFNLDWSDITLPIDMNSITSMINTSIGTITDQRGGNNLLNSNYGNSAFTGLNFYYTSANNTFNLSSDPNSVCYVKSLVDVNGGLINNMHLSGSPTKTLFNINGSISQNILDVVNSLNQRSEITVNNIYVSPIIQDFSLSGTIYINPLFDVGTVKNSITNSIYKFLDDQSDFNTPIYLSNIIKLIQSVNGVKYSDVNFVPDYPINPLTSATGGNFYYDDFVNGLLAGWVNINWPSSLSLSGLPFLLNSTMAGNYGILTERDFFNVIKKYLETQKLIGNPFLKSNNFLRIIGALHKDYTRFIRQSLINTNGDIGQSVFTNNKYLYGYSIGTEIPRVSCDLKFQYKN